MERENALVEEYKQHNDWVRVSSNVFAVLFIFIVTVNWYAAKEIVPAVFVSPPSAPRLWVMMLAFCFGAMNMVAVVASGWMTRGCESHHARVNVIVTDLARLSSSINASNPQNCIPLKFVRQVAGAGRAFLCAVTLGWAGVALLALL